MSFNVGDKVYVKLWNEMLADERVLQDHKGNLYEKDKPGNSFVKEMRRFCGSAAFITDISKDGVISLFFDGFEGGGYYFRDWMLEPAEEKMKVHFVQRSDE